MRVAALVVFIAGIVQGQDLADFRIAAKEPNRIPMDLQAILEKADSIELISLSPSRLKEEPKDAFHGWKMLGKTTVNKAEDRKALVEAFVKGVAENKGMAARCFNPRHGIRAKHDGKTADFVICFECYQVHAYLDDGKAKYFLISRSPTELFNKTLMNAKVELPEQPKD